MAKKVEHDWKMSYLARCEGSPSEVSGHLIWAFDLNPSVVQSWVRLRICINAAAYENAAIELSLHSKPDSNHALSVPFNETIVIHRDQFPKDCEGFILRATLSGGSGNVGWQKAQLFRQSIVKDQDKDGLELEVAFK
jgi:hypothetical protein